MSKNNSTKILVQCALFLAFGLVLRNFSYMVYMGGGTGMRLGISGFFTKMPAIHFGPVYGAVVSGLTDILGFLLKPEGGYIFPLSITAACGGAVTGFLFRAFKKHSVTAIRNIYISIIVLVGLFGIFNHVTVAFFPDSLWGVFLGTLNKKIVYFTYGAYIICGLGILFYLINLFLQHRYKNLFVNEYLKMFITLLIADVFVTTVNTFILIAFIPTLAKLPFMTFYLPRLAQELVSVFINSYVLSYMYELYSKISKRG